MDINGLFPHHGTPHHFERFSMFFDLLGHWGLGSEVESRLLGNNGIQLVKPKLVETEKDNYNYILRYDCGQLW